MRWKKLLLPLLSFFSAIAISFSANAQTAPKLGLPISCTLGEDCFILQYFDRDPGPGATDFSCGRMTSDGHDGTDFAISDEQTMASGIPVLAAEKGTVLRIRDGIPDLRLEGDSDLSALEGSECGNGAIVDHGGGWETQYCHLRQGSVTVAPGDQISQGDVLGFVGESGLASFPHVHFTVRHQNEEVDPFVGLVPPANCQDQPRQPLWKTEVTYSPTGLIRAGFSDRPPEIAELWAGQFDGSRLPKDSSAIVFWTHIYGVLEGDIEQIQLLDPSGTVVAENQQSLSKSQRIWTSFIGKRANSNNDFAAGTWHGRYVLERDGEILIQSETAIELTANSLSLRE
ncbi:MAG: M23 family metallopeptidase [Cyanobacteria bacterium J06642_2]